MPEPKRCEARQVSDQMRCERCDLTWDINDPDPPPCPLQSECGNPTCAKWDVNQAMKIKGMGPGRFTLSDALLCMGEPEVLLAVMARCAVVRAEHLFVPGRIEYHAYSPDFDPIDDGEAVPNYEWQFTEERNDQGERVKLEVTAVRQE